MNIRDLLRRRALPKDTPPDSAVAVIALTSDEQTKRTLSQLAVRGQWNLAFAGAGDEALAMLTAGHPAVILCDREMQNLDWRGFFKRVAAYSRQCATILTSSTYSERLWDEVIRSGGYDVLAKPLNEDQTLGAVNLAWLYARRGLIRK